MISDLASESDRTREAALIALGEQPASSVLKPLADLMIEDSSHFVHGACLDLMERFGAVVSLSEVRLDGWFDQLSEEISNFDKIGSIVGKRFLAYSIILGVQIRSLTTDPRYQANSVVEFTAGDEQVQTLTLGEFRVRIVQSIIQDQREPVSLNLPLSTADATAIIGGRNLLLAPLFSISIDKLILADLDLRSPQAIVGYISEQGYNFLSLRDFEELIKGKARRDLAGTQEEPFMLDLEAVDRARQAFDEGDLDRVIAMLQTWPGLLSVLHRTPVVKDLEQEQLEKISEGLEILGLAFQERDRKTWSEELFRLGLQFSREGEVAARIFHHLGLLLVKNQRFGEAIGLFRRAIKLGVSESEILPLLGRAFLKTDKVIAASALLKKASAIGCDSLELKEDLTAVDDILERAGQSWNVPPYAP